MFLFENDANKKGSQKRVVIAGGGPAGLLLALRLLERDGYEVIIVERRPDFRLQPEPQTRSYPIVLQFRAQNALKGFMDQIREKGVQLSAVSMHKNGGKTRLVPRENFSIDRNHIVMTLLEQLEEKAKNASQTSKSRLMPIRFNTSLEEIDLEQKEIVVDCQNKKERIPFDHLVAADGAGSTVRRKLAGLKMIKSEEKVIPDDYRTIYLSDKSLNRGHLHGWMFDDGSKIIAAPIHQNCISGVYVFNKGTDPFATMSSPQDVVDFFKGLTPNIHELITTEEAKALLQRPTSTSLSVRCDRLNAGNDKIVLLGDAAHAVHASLGQGCNSALEDVQIFCQLLDQHEDDWAMALPAYTEKRLPDALAVCQVSEYASPRTKWMKMEWILRTILNALLPLWISKLFLRPMPMELLRDESLSYSQVLEKTEWWITRVKKTQDA